MNEGSRTSGMGLWTDARQMLAAAKHLSTVKGFELSQPLYYLLGHATELAFKSYVRANGATEGCLKNIGHDLTLGLNWAITIGLEKIVSITNEDKAAILQLNSYYKEKEFEYRKTGSKIYPQADYLILFIERVLDATKSICASSVGKD